MWIYPAPFCFRWKWRRIGGAACSCGERDQRERRLLLQKVHTISRSYNHTRVSRICYVSKRSFPRCKLFYKKDGEFKEKGVGTLHLKMVAESKLQLLVRADTNLGKCLLQLLWMHQSTVSPCRFKKPIMLTNAQALLITTCLLCDLKSRLALPLGCFF